VKEPITNRNVSPDVGIELPERKTEANRDKISSWDDSSHRHTALEILTSRDGMDTDFTGDSPQQTWLKPAFTESLVAHMHAAKQLAVADQRE
jgi:hypothetical protein